MKTNLVSTTSTKVFQLKVFDSACTASNCFKFGQLLQIDSFHRIVNFQLRFDKFPIYFSCENNLKTDFFGYFEDCWDSHII